MARWIDAVQKVFSTIIIGYAALLYLFLLLRLLLGDRWESLAFLNNFTPFYFLPLIVLLPLAILLQTPRAFLAVLPLSILGAIWFGRLYLPKASIEPSGTVLRVLTFNVSNKNTQTRQAVPWLVDQHQDILSLQEVWSGWNSRFSDGLHSQLPYTAEHHEPGASNRGDLTLSRYPILEQENSPETGATRTLMCVGGKQVAFYNVSLDTPVSSAIPDLSGVRMMDYVLDYNDDDRDQQIDRLLTRLKQEQNPFILAGDFNLSDQSAVYNAFSDAGLSDSFREAGTGLGTSWPLPSIYGLPTFLPPLVRIDYIWHTADFKTLEASQGANMGSDHLPLSATLELSDDAPATSC